MDLTTNYLGLTLKNPLIVSACPLSESIDNYKRMEDAGASCVVQYSLFEEQITREIYESDHFLNYGTESYAESISFFPPPTKFALGPDEYCDHIKKAKQAVDIPVIASLNGHTLGGWTKYAKHMQEAGADALELNIYYLATNPEDTSESIENNYLQIVESVSSTVTLPISVKISPYFSALSNVAQKITQNGAKGLVLFNRFYQPDIDLEELSILPNLLLSSPADMRLPLRWIAILHDKVKADMAASGGIAKGTDVIKMMMVGAKATMLCTALLRNGIPYLTQILDEVTLWMQENEYESIAQMQGSMSQKSLKDPELFERANYMKVLKSYVPENSQLNS